MIGSKFLGEKLADNIACSDIGGTSFDMAIITKGNFAIQSDPDMARLLLSLPLVAMDSVGAGAGSFIRIDPYSKAIKLDRTARVIGSACVGRRRLDTVSVSDCHVVLGYLNPDNFLGGAIKLDANRARKYLKEQIADPLGLTVEDAAAGVIELLDLNLREYMRSVISAKGYNPSDFVCFSYGGAGPVHTYGIRKGWASRTWWYRHGLPASPPSVWPAPNTNTAMTRASISASVKSHGRRKCKRVKP